MTAAPIEPTRLPWSVDFDGSGYDREWLVPQVVPMLCHGHGQGDDVFLCSACSEALLLMLADVPALLLDVELALTRQTAWVEQGTSTAAPAEVDSEGQEGPLPYDQRASRAIVGLAVALQSPSPRLGDIAARSRLLVRRLPLMLTDPGLPRLADRIARAVLYAHQVIERPPEAWYYGPCPLCRVDIYDERAVPVVECPECDYRAPLAEHQRVCLDLGEDRLLTVTELVGAITSAGETVTRDQINGWIRRRGLARDQENRPAWRNGVLVSDTVWVYRLGDVRRLAQQSADWRVE